MLFGIPKHATLILIILIHPIQAHLLSLHEDKNIASQQSLNNFKGIQKYEINKEGNVHHHQKIHTRLLNSSLLLKKRSKDDFHSNNYSTIMEEKSLKQITFKFAIKQLPSDLTIRDVKAEGTEVKDQPSLQQILSKILEKFSLRVGGQFKSYYRQTVDAMLRMRTLRAKFYFFKWQMSDSEQYKANCLQLKAASCKVLNQLLGLKDELQQDFTFSGKQSQDLVKLLGFCLKEARSLFIQLSAQVSDGTLNSMRRNYKFEFTFYQSAEWTNSRARKRFSDLDSADYYSKEWHRLVQKLFQIQSQQVQVIKIGTSMNVGSEQKWQAHRKMKSDWTAISSDIQEIKSKVAEDSQNASRKSKDERDKIVLFADKVIQFGKFFSSCVDLLTKSDMSASRSTLGSTSSIQKVRSTLSTLKKTFARRSSKSFLLSNSRKNSIQSLRSQTLSISSNSFRSRVESSVQSEQSSFQSMKSLFQSMKNWVRQEKSSVQSKTKNQTHREKKDQASSMMRLTPSKEKNPSPRKWRSRSQSDLGSTKTRLTLKMSSRSEHHSNGQFRRYTHYQSKDNVPSHLKQKAKSLSQLAAQAKGKFNLRIDKFAQKRSEKEELSIDGIEPQKLIIPITRLCERDKHLQLTFKWSKLTKTERGLRIMLFSIAEKQNEMKVKDKEGLLKLGKDCSDLIENILQQLQAIAKQDMEMPKKVLEGFQKWGALLEEDLNNIKKDVDHLLSAPLVDSHQFQFSSWIELRRQINGLFSKQVTKIDKGDPENKLLSKFSMLNLLHLQVETIYLDVFDLVLFSNYPKTVIALLMKQNLASTQIIKQKVEKKQKKAKKDNMKLADHQLIQLMIRDLKMKINLLLTKINDWLQTKYT